MARGANFYYGGDAQLGQSLGASLGRAFFGDPELAAKQQLQRAQMANYDASAEEARQHGLLYGTQATDQTMRTDGSRALSEIFHGFAQGAPTAVPAGPDAAPVAITPETIKSALPGMLAAMALAKGDNLPVAETLAQLPAYFGDDDTRRAAIIAQGHATNEDFAGTAERADAVSGRDAKESLGQAIATANIGAATARRGQDISATTQRRGQDLTHEDRVLGITTKPGVVIANEAGGNVIARALGPGAVITDNARTHEQADAIYAQQHPGKKPPEHSNHYAEQGYTAFDVRPVPGMTFEEARAKVAAQAAAQGGYVDADTRNEGSHWHMVIKGVKGSTATAKAAGGGKAPKAISAASAKLLDDELDRQLASRGLNAQGRARENMRISAQKNFQSSGNPADAVHAVMAAYDRASASKGKGNGPPVAGARQAPDGHWYVQKQGKYFRVDAS